MGAPACRRGERGFMLTLVLITFLVIEVIAVGVLSVVMSDLHSAVASQQAMQSVNVAEAGLHYGVSRLVSLASAGSSRDESYEGESRDVVLTDATGAPTGAFHVSVRCAYPSGARPPACQDNPGTAAVDERNLRVIISAGFVPARPGRARRQIEAAVRRYAPGPSDTGVFGICGRDRVELGPETSVIADIGSNGDVVIEGQEQNPRPLRRKEPPAPAFAATVEAARPTGPAGGLTGRYTWRVTVVNAAGDESGGSPPTPAVLLTSQSGYLTNIPVGDATTVRRRIYRTAQGSPRGPWFLVGEILDNVSQEYTDPLADEALRWRLPGNIDGSITAAGEVACARGCARQAEGQTLAGVRDVVCPNFLAPPVRPGTRPAPDQITQSAATQTMRWSSLHVGEYGELTIETLSEPNAHLHIHLTDLRLERGATLAITGQATVYFHISGTFTLGRDAVFGASDFDGHLLKPSDRVQVLISARDPSFPQTGIASVRLERSNKVSALLFAPEANIVVDRATAFSGGLYGKYVRVTRSSGFVLDPTEGIASERSAVRPSPYQYLLRWHDNPNPAP